MSFLFLPALGRRDFLVSRLDEVGWSLSRGVGSDPDVALHSASGKCRHTSHLKEEGMTIQEKLFLEALENQLLKLLRIGYLLQELPFTPSLVSLRNICTGTFEQVHSSHGSRHDKQLTEDEGQRHRQKRLLETSVQHCRA